MKKTLWMFILSILLLLAVFSGVVQAKNADVFAISGGSSLQRQYVKQALEESTWDWHYGQDVFPSTKVEITPNVPGYWNDTGVTISATEVLPQGTIVYPYYDTNGDAVGLAYYPEGNIKLREKYMVVEPKGYLWEVADHEAAHARIWFVWMARANGLDDTTPECLAWKTLVTQNTPTNIVGSTWYYDPAENFAESHRAYYGNAAVRHANATPRSSLTILTPSITFQFMNYYAYGIGTPPTIPLPPGTILRIDFANDHPFRTEFSDVFYMEWMVNGYVTGPGTIWFIPEGDNWQEFTTAGIQGNLYVEAGRTDRFFDIDIGIKPDTSLQGPVFHKFKLVFKYDDANQVSVEAAQWFDVTVKPFSDFTQTELNDWDLYKSVWGMKNQKLMLGYTDGTFGLWNNLLKRQVYLIATRAGLIPPELWKDDYSLATRGDVNLAIPGLLWDSQRWDELVLRSQLARLITRGQPES